VGEIGVLARGLRERVAGGLPLLGLHRREALGEVLFGRLLADLHHVGGRLRRRRAGAGRGERTREDGQENLARTHGRSVPVGRAHAAPALDDARLVGRGLVEDQLPALLLGSGGLLLLGRLLVRPGGRLALGLL